MSDITTSFHAILCNDAGLYPGSTRAGGCYVSEFGRNRFWPGQRPIHSTSPRKCQTMREDVSSLVADAGRLCSGQKHDDLNDSLGATCFERAYAHTVLPTTTWENSSSPLRAGVWGPHSPWPLNLQPLLCAMAALCNHDHCEQSML